MVRTYIIVTRNQAPFNCAASGCAGVSPAVSVESNQNNRRGKIYVSSAGRGRDAHAPRGIRIVLYLSILSTVLGMIPFLIDGYDEQPFWFSLAVGTIGGLALSVIPIFLFLPIVMRLDGYFNCKKSSV